MAVSSVYQDSRRKAYDNAVNILQSSKQYLVNKPIEARAQSKLNIRMAQSSLVSIIPINVNTTDYVLNVMDNQVNAGNTGLLPQEQRLTLQDVFFTSSLGFFLVPLVNNGYTPIHFQYYTYPDNALGGISGIGDPAALMGIWTAGQLEVKVNGEVVTPRWWLERHAVINQTQDNIAGIPTNPFWSQQNFAEDGYLITEPNWIINGGNNNLYTIKYSNDWGQVLGGANTGNSVTFAIALVWDGWLAQNASSIMNNEPQK